MQYIKQIDILRKQIKEYKKQGKIIGLVPTMGALHEGHASLFDAARKECDIVVASVFVNPIQFGPNEDFDKYPRPIEDDKKVAETHGVDILFNPEVEEIIGDNLLAFVDINKLSDNLCGAKRPGHFRGVCTIVSKLFNIVTPDKGFFGKKDIQQLMIIKKFVADLNFDIEIIGCPIIRESDGLAKSSRNKYLSDSERQDAAVINIALKHTVEMYNKGEKNAAKLTDAFLSTMFNIASAKIDYVHIVDENMQNVQTATDGNILAAAVYIGNTRLIDNHILGEQICW
ncbi:MAG: pantoate--beta-alanine ligase [Spirochaetales bacterium]|nr:pantoate--beta-alanine ligase [Spirochaetales bacterium]MBR6201326.1 pantoate--beta-alanine ligase [Spirochaetales bacterium]